MKPVKIKPQIAFANGNRVTATQLSVVSINDNLFDHVKFKYTLLEESGNFAGESTYELRGDDYTKWDNSPEGAYIIVAEGIGVEIVNEATRMFEVV
jgi:hypothetical protein